MAEERIDELPVTLEGIQESIYLIRGQRVMLDEDLADLYGVTTGALNQAVSRNTIRFPIDFMFQLTAEEWENLKSQFVISSGHGGRRKLPNVFTQEGVAMLSGVLNSERAIRVNVEIMRVFVRFRNILAGQDQLRSKLEEIEKRFDKRLAKHDEHIRALFEVMRLLRDEIHKSPPLLPKRKIGFHVEEDDGGKKPRASRKGAGKKAGRKG